MLNANYTSGKICRALGLGGFADDAPLADAAAAIRLLLTPSFHPEVCISFLRCAGAPRVQVVAAVAQVWRQTGVAPRRTAVEAAEGTIDDASFDDLAGLLADAACCRDAKWVILDGMGVHSLLLSGGETRVDLARNAGEVEAYAAFVLKAIDAAWRSVVDAPAVRNALRDAGAYVGLDLPAQEVPPAKPSVRVAVLGEAPATGQVIDALAARHPRRR
jgi:hypothetical protein